jgi:hypothetical protein
VKHGECAARLLSSIGAEERAGGKLRRDLPDNPQAALNEESQGAEDGEGGNSRVEEVCERVRLDARPKLGRRDSVCGKDGVQRSFYRSTEGTHIEIS